MIFERSSDVNVRRSRPCLMTPADAIIIVLYTSSHLLKSLVMATLLLLHVLDATPTQHLNIVLQYHVSV